MVVPGYLACIPTGVKTLYMGVSGGAQEYIAAYGLNHAKLKGAKPDVLILHPGPVNRGVELTNELADDPVHSVIREQVEMGVAIRMAVIDLLVSA